MKEIHQGSVLKLKVSPDRIVNALVISNTSLQKHTGMILVCPIVKTDKTYPLHIPMEDGRCRIFCEQIRSIDLHEADYEIVGSVPDQILKSVIQVINAEMQAE